MRLYAFLIFVKLAFLGVHIWSNDFRSNDLVALVLPRIGKQHVQILIPKVSSGEKDSVH